MRERFFNIIFLLCFLLVLSSCTTKPTRPLYHPDIPPVTYQNYNEYLDREEYIFSGGRYKVGRPYKIYGIMYEPEVNYDYDEMGIASWYGPKFHGKLTANGEVFDMYSVGAAHNTLPIPSIVRVTNLENGRSLLVRVNDRGPYAHNRIIDLSYRAAQLLDIVRKGTAKVRVQVLSDASRLIAEGVPYVKVVNDDKAHPILPLQPELKTVSQVIEEKPASMPIVHTHGEGMTKPVASKIFVQAGAFSDQENAKALADKLKSLSKTRIQEAMVGGKQFFRVQVGPVKNVLKADELLARVVAQGLDHAKIIVSKG